MFIVCVIQYQRKMSSKIEVRLHSVYDTLFDSVLTMPPELIHIVCEYSDPKYECKIRGCSCCVVNPLGVMNDSTNDENSSDFIPYKDIDKTIFCCKTHIYKSFRCEGCHNYFLGTKKKLCRQCEPIVKKYRRKVDSPFVWDFFRIALVRHNYYMAKIVSCAYVNNDVRLWFRYAPDIEGNKSNRIMVNNLMERISYLLSNGMKTEEDKNEHYYNIVKYIYDSFNELLYGKKREFDTIIVYNQEHKKIIKYVKDKRVDLNEHEKEIEEYMSTFM